MKRTKEGYRRFPFQGIVDAIFDTGIAVAMGMKFGVAVGFFCFGVLRTLNQILATLNAPVEIEQTTQ